MFTAALVSTVPIRAKGESKQNRHVPAVEGGRPLVARRVGVREVGDDDVETEDVVVNKETT